MNQQLPNSVSLGDETGAFVVKYRADAIVVKILFVAFLIIGPAFTLFSYDFDRGRISPIMYLYFACFALTIYILASIAFNTISIRIKNSELSVSSGPLPQLPIMKFHQAVSIPSTLITGIECKDAVGQGSLFIYRVEVSCSDGSAEDILFSTKMETSYAIAQLLRERLGLKSGEQTS